MIINHNLSAMNAQRQMGVNQTNATKSMEKLSSGLRINRAGDDAAGLAISEKMRGQIRGLDQASRNAQDGISMIQTAEGALTETHSILQRMRELSVQAANDTNTADDRGAIGDELVALKEEIDRIADTTSFNGRKLLNGDMSTTIDGSSELQVGKAAGTGVVISNIDVSKAKGDEEYTFTYDAGKLTLTRTSDNVAQTITLDDLNDETKTLSFDKLGISMELTGKATKDVIGAALKTTATDTIKTAAGTSSAELVIGANGTADETITVNFDNMDSGTLGLDTLIADRNAVATKDEATALTAQVDEAIKSVSEQRSKLGAVQNRLEHTIANLGTSSENLTAAESRVRDVDMAKEMMTMSKNNILQQASQAMLAQANQTPQQVLQLLR